MGNPRHSVVDWIRNSQLPTSFEPAFDDWFNREKGTFDLQESVHWDYKDSFPSSMSDDYFGGIVRLICAFFNTFGGVILFGVHDKTREGGHNKIDVNVERLNQSLRLNLTCVVEVIHRKYDFQCAQGRHFTIEALLIPKRPMSVPPVRSKTKFGSYPSDVIWLRKQHECIAAKSIDVPLLYSSRDGYGLEFDEEEGNIDSSIPGNPATLREFVGRFDVLDQLLLWLFVEDEPRKFLWGRGGSGKSTIAYEFSRVIARSCGTIPTSIGRPIDHVIFLSAKKQALDPLSGERRSLADYDFASSRELFERVLSLSGWMSEQETSKKADREILSELQALFDTLQVLLVIDDIDTLTTAGIDPGMDSLFRLISRAKSGGKILYTLRNAPTHQDNEATEYSVGQATLDFLKLVGPQLEYYEKVRYGVKYYISSHLAEDPQVSKGISAFEGRDPVKVDDQSLLDRLRRGVRVQIVDLQKVGVRS